VAGYTLDWWTAVARPSALAAVTAMLQLEGWQVNHKLVERIWRQEGLKVPKKQPK
jgi:hypothetical protein